MLYHFLVAKKSTLIKIQKKQSHIIFQWPKRLQKREYKANVCLQSIINSVKKLELKLELELKLKN